MTEMASDGAPIDPVRALTAILGALVLFSAVSQLLEFTLIRAAAGESITTMANYLAVLSRPAILATKVALNIAISILTGYLCARIAGTREMLFAAIAAAAETCTLVYGFTTGEYAALPIGVRALLVATAGPGMMAGAWIRRQARFALEAAQ
jgi:hypothetical protein